MSERDPLHEPAVDALEEQTTGFEAGSIVSPGSKHPKYDGHADTTAQALDALPPEFPSQAHEFD